MGNWDVVKTEKINEWDVVSREPFPTREISAVTGQPVATSAERIEAGTNLAAEAIPVAADIALTAAAPQLALASKIPTALRLGGKALNLGSRALSGAVGGMWGEAERQKITGENNPDAIALSGAVGPAAEVIGPVVGKVAKAGATAISEASIAGKLVKNWQRKKLTGQVDNFVRKMAPDVNPDDAIGALGDAIVGGKKAASKAYDEYKPFLPEIAKNPEYGDGNRLYMNNLFDHLEEVREQIKGQAGSGHALNRKDANHQVVQYFGLDPNAGTGKALSDLLETGTVDPLNVPALHTIYSGKNSKNEFKDLLPSERVAREKLKSVVLTDLDNIIVKIGEEQAEKTIGEIIRAADENYKAVAEYFKKNPVAKKIIEPFRKDASGRMMYEAAPEMAIRKIFESTPITIQTFKENVLKLPDGEKVWAGIEYGWVKDMFDRAVKESAENGDRKLMPWQLIKEVDANAAKLDMIDPNLRKGINKQIDFLRDISAGFRDLDSAMGGGKLLAAAGSSAVAFKANIATAGAYEVLAAASAYASLSPRLQKHLGTLNKTALKIGGHEVAKMGGDF